MRIETKSRMKDAHRDITRLSGFWKTRDETGRDENLVSSRREISRDCHFFRLYRATIKHKMVNFCHFWPVLAIWLGFRLKGLIFQIMYFYPVGRDNILARRDETRKSRDKTRRIRDFWYSKIPNSRLSRKIEKIQCRDGTRRDCISRLVSPRNSRPHISRPTPNW